MSDETIEKPLRLNQWFARGIGIIVTGLFILTMIYCLFEIDQSLFSNDLLPIIDFDYVLIAKQMGNYLWTFRVYDLILVVILLIIVAIASYYLVNYKSIIKKRRQIKIRRDQF